MALDKQDLKEIKSIVIEAVDVRVTKSEAYLKDYVDFKVDNLEDKMKDKFEKFNTRFEKIEDKLEKIDTNISDLIETNQKFLEIHTDHEKRITKIETKLEMKSV